MPDLALIPLSALTGWLDYILANPGDFATMLRSHVTMVFIAEFIAIAVAVPAGIAATRNPTISTIVMNTGAIAQTLPALGVIALSFAYLGIGMRPAILAMTIYALLPMLKNTVAGIENIDESKVRAGRGMGMTMWERLRRIELPLALPVIFAGIRTSTVLCVGVAYLGAFIGAGGLGDLVTRGLSTVDTSLMLAGAIPGALLVLFFDQFFKYLESYVTPEGVAVQQQTDDITA
ncbi:ABC transporter permease [Halosolutus amylolyticus]|uniref:ABC transporter permease n=1 Tax=Halosolutus amylolyticus TaxID=2932267 RepID=A0ABD5PIT9_9EURY|nr:ABC transporter permease [Halosolutus amylolyticus]